MKISARWIIIGIDEDCLRMEMHSPLEKAGRNSKFEPSIDLLFLLGVEKIPTPAQDFLI
jgi:hypothetical protein